ncbi:MAG: hemolysin family protein [Methanothrix sp.]|nr:hemolysin family protein [Methanothrix sp.]HPY72872.1 hemolysin family protein [Methanothrix sp.]HQA63253.1 hemolysin family protein [Methanothrix sp.]
MDLSTTILLALFCLLLCLSAFFSASETALMSLSKIRLIHMLEEKVRGASVINLLREDPSKLLGTILVGNNLVNISASSIATVLAIKYFGDAGVGIATGITTALVLVFAEITPKALAAQKSEKIALVVAKPIFILTTILAPIVFVFTQIASLFLRLLGCKYNDNLPTITEEELKSLVNLGEEEGVIEDQEKTMICNVFDFKDHLIKDVMIQRMDVVAININASYDEIINKIRTEQYSRFPIYSNKIDNIIGILNVKELVYRDLDEVFDIKKFMKKPYYTFEYMNTSELFNEMKKGRTHMAIVLDEYGGTVGIVTFEDLVEEIVGEISDEYDMHTKEIEIIQEGEYIVNGSTRIEELNELIGTKIESEHYESVGGFIIELMGRLPKQGESVEHMNTKFIIENMERNRIKKIKVLMTETMYEDKLDID